MSLYISNKKINTVYTGGATISDGLWSGNRIYSTANFNEVEVILSTCGIAHSINTSWVITYRNYTTKQIIKKVPIRTFAQQIRTHGVDFDYVNYCALSSFTIVNGGAILAMDIFQNGNIVDFSRVKDPGCDFLRYCGGSNRIDGSAIFSFVLKPEHTNFMSSPWSSNLGLNSVRFTAVQTITNSPMTHTAQTDLYIKNGSAAVNVTNRTWAGKTFRSITLI